MIRRSWLSTVGAIFYLHIGRAQLDQTRLRLRDDTWTLAEIPRVSHDITLTTCRRHPRAKVFANLSFNFIKFPKDTFSRSHAYTDLHIYAQLSLNRHQYIYIYMYTYIYTCIYMYIMYIYNKNLFYQIIIPLHGKRKRSGEWRENFDSFYDFWIYLLISRDEIR